MTPRRALLCLSDPAVAAAVAERLLLDGIDIVTAAPDADPDATVRRALESGGLDVVVTDLVSPEPRPFIGTDPTVWFAEVSTALSRPFFLLRSATVALTAGSDARIVLVGNGWAAAADTNSTAASSVQGAGVALVKTLARDLGPHGITVNEVSAPTSSPAPSRAIAAAVSYLVSPLAGATTGQVLTVGTGGELRP